MTNKERVAMQQALEALYTALYQNQYWELTCSKAITALREALAEQAEREPVSMKMVDWHMNPMTGEVFIPVKQHDWPESDEHKRQLVEGQRKWLAEQADHSGKATDMVQEPVAWMNQDGWCSKIKPEDAGWTPLYAAPVRTKDLTDDEIELLANHELRYLQESYELTGVFDFARAVIAADREKNK